VNDRWDIRAFLLDMDGTLLDTEKVYFEALRAAMEALGSTDDPAALFQAMVGVPGPQCEAMLLERYGKDFPLAEFNAVFNATCKEVLKAGLPLKRGVVTFLDALREAGHPYAIVTSTSRRTTEQHLTLAGIRGRFDVIVTGSDITHGKPHPEPYLLGAERIGAKPGHCLAVEDSAPGVASAHAAGTITVMVPDILPPAPETQAKCAAVLPDLCALLALLREQGALGR
jgi:HAD superfamily hydrolase (TIGR01509 family)